MEDGKREVATFLVINKLYAVGYGSADCVLFKTALPQHHRQEKLLIQLHPRQRRHQFRPAGLGGN